MPEKPQPQPSYHTPEKHEEIPSPMMEQEHESSPPKSEKPEKPKKPENPEKNEKNEKPEYSPPEQHASVPPPSPEAPAEQPKSMPEESLKKEMPEEMPKEVPKMQSSYAPSMPMQNGEAVQHAAPHMGQQPSHAPAMQASYMPGTMPQSSWPKMSYGGSGYPMQAQHAQPAMVYHQQSYAPAAPVSQSSQNQFGAPAWGNRDVPQTHGYPMQASYMQSAVQPVSMPKQHQQAYSMPQTNQMTSPAAMPHQHGEEMPQTHSYGIAPAAPAQHPSEQPAAQAIAPQANYMKASSRPAVHSQPQPQPQQYQAASAPEISKEEEKPNVSYQHD